MLAVRATGLLASIAVLAAACAVTPEKGTTTGAGAPSAGGSGGSTTASATTTVTTTASTTGSGLSHWLDVQRGFAKAVDGPPACSVDGETGACIDVSLCASLGDTVSTPGYCAGAANIECCRDAPDVADNPPIPTGWKPMQQAMVTPEMTTWAVAILHDPTTYPMYATTMMTFGTLLVMARVEWHPPDFQNSVVHRGVTLYVPG